MGRFHPGGDWEQLAIGSAVGAAGCTVLGPLVSADPLSGASVVIWPVIRRRVRGDPMSPPFRYRDEGALATIGRHSAIADFGWVRLTGFSARVIWSIVHIFFLIGFRNRASVFLNWVWAWVTYSRGARRVISLPT
jgi:hypothetical protein